MTPARESLDLGPICVDFLKSRVEKAFPKALAKVEQASDEFGSALG